MKRWIAMLLALVALLCAGCGEEPAAPTDDTTIPTETTDSGSEDTQPTTTEPTEPPTLANAFFDPEESKHIIGIWTVDVVLDGSILNFTDMESSVTMKMRYQLNNDGTYTRGVEQSEFDTAIESYENYVRNYMLSKRYASFLAETKLDKKSEEQIKAEWEQTGWPQAQLEVNDFVDGLYLGYRFSTLNRSGDYYTTKEVLPPDPAAETETETVVTEDVLYLSMGDGTYEQCRYTVTDDFLTLLDTTDQDTFSQVSLRFPLVLSNKNVSKENTTTTEATDPTETNE